MANVGDYTTVDGADLLWRRLAISIGVWQFGTRDWLNATRCAVAWPGKPIARIEIDRNVGEHGLAAYR